MEAVRSAADTHCSSIHWSAAVMAASTLSVFPCCMILEGCCNGLVAVTSVGACTNAPLLGLELELRALAFPLPLPFALALAFPLLLPLPLPLPELADALAVRRPRLEVEEEEAGEEAPPAAAAAFDLPDRRDDMVFFQFRVCRQFEPLAY